MTDPITHMRDRAAAICTEFEELCAKVVQQSRDDDEKVDKFAYAAVMALKIRDAITSLDLLGDADITVFVTSPDWQLIETAPRDGTPILMFWRSDEVTLIDYCCWEEWCHSASNPEVCGQGSFVFVHALHGLQRSNAFYTHWMPLASPPRGVSA